MCGIFGYVGSKKNAAHLVLEGLKTLEYRGYDSWGIAAVPAASQNAQRIIVKKRTGKIGDANIEGLPESSLAFGHTRWATHGGVTEPNAHPHLDCTKTIAVIHNGIIENWAELKKKLNRKGHVFHSETDTEVAVHLIEEYAKSMPVTKAIQKAFNEMEGLNAFIVLDAREEMLIAVRNSSPLIVGFGNGENILASDAVAILPYTRQVHYLSDNEMIIAHKNDIHIYNVRTGEVIIPVKQHLNWSIEQAAMGTYPNYLLKEIHEQPGIVSDIATNYGAQAEKLADVIKKSYGTYMVGCGTASYACMIGSYLFSKIAKRHVNWAIGSEFTYQLDFLTKKSLVIALSQSGETMDTLESVKFAKAKGAKIFALVNVLGSSLYRIADYKMMVGAGLEKSVCSTKAFTAKLAHLVLLSYALANKLKEGQKILMTAAKSCQKILSVDGSKRIHKLAEKLSGARYIFVIGRGLSYPVSLETALKIKEISYIHAEGMAAGELKHGPLALIEKGVPCIAFLPNDETYAANLAAAMEIKARGGYIIGVSYKPDDMFDFYIPITDAREATVIPNTVFAQLLAYHLTMKKGFDPDKPRNLAKSVTVK